MKRIFNDYIFMVNGIITEITYIDIRHRVIDIVEKVTISTPFGGEEEIKMEKSLFLDDFKDTLKEMLEDNETNVSMSVFNYPKWRSISKVCLNGKVYWNERSGGC